MRTGGFSTPLGTRSKRNSDDDLNELFANVAATTNILPPFARTPNLIVDFWLDRLLGFAISPGKRNVMVNFVAQGGGLDDELPNNSDTSNNSDYQRRVRGLVELITMSPEFMMR